MCTSGSLCRSFGEFFLRLLGWGFGLFGPGHLLEHLARRVDVDRAPATGIFAEAAAGALLLVEDGDAEEVAVGALGLAEVQRLERADLDAQLAARADAVVLDDDRLRPLLAGERLTDIAHLVEDGLGRADDATGATIDAQVGIDDVDHVPGPGDGVRRAALGAGRTADTGVDNRIGH